MYERQYILFAFSLSVRSNSGLTGATVFSLSSDARSE